MYRALPVYLLLLALVNGLIGWSGGLLVHGLRVAYAELLNNQLPAVTLYALPLPWAFYVVGLLALLAAVLTGKQKIAALPALHSAAGLVAVDGTLLTFALIGYVTPFFTLTTTL